MDGQRALRIDSSRTDGRTDGRTNGRMQAEMMDEWQTEPDTDRQAGWQTGGRLTICLSFAFAALFFSPSSLRLIDSDFCSSSTCSTVSRIFCSPTFRWSCCSSRSDRFSLNSFTWRTDRTDRQTSEQPQTDRQTRRQISASENVQPPTADAWRTDSLVVR